MNCVPQAEEWISVPGSQQWPRDHLHEVGGWGLGSLDGMEWGMYEAWDVWMGKFKAVEGKEEIEWDLGKEVGSREVFYFWG